LAYLARRGPPILPSSAWQLMAAGLYSRSRGHGADDMLLTNAGLWIASDNFGGNTQCGGVSGYAGICLLPYPA